MLNERDSQMVSVMKWAVNPSLPVPKIELPDEEYIAEMAIYHRIPQRLLARLQTERPQWATPRLLTRLRIYLHQCKQSVNRKIAAAHEISEATQQCGLHRPIWVKGFTTYALTGSEINRHHSNDLDPFAEYLPAFCDILHSLGYIGKRKETHEWAKFWRDSITIDIHRHYPSLAYPECIRWKDAISLLPESNPGHWLLSATESDLIENSSIVWNDFANEAMPGIAVGTESLLFPSPTWMCLIHCVHCFRSTITRLHYMDARGGFRLYEIINIFLLARHPSFNSELFLARVEKFGAGDALALMNSLSHIYLGESMLPLPARQFRGDAIYAEHLIFGGWIGARQNDEWLTWRGMDSMLRQLQPMIWKSGIRLNCTDIPRQIVYGAPTSIQDLRIVWHEAEKWVSVEWTIVCPASDLELLVHFGYQVNIRAFLSGDAVEVFHKAEQWQIAVPASAVMETVDTDCARVTMICPLPEFPERFSSDRAILPLLIAAKQSEKVSYFPLLITSSCYDLCESD